MAQEISEGRRPADEKLEALKAESRRKRDSLKQRVIQELQAGAASIALPPEEAEGLMDELTIMLIHQNPGGSMLDISPMTTVTLGENGAQVQTACHMRQSFIRLEAAFINQSTYQNGPVENPNQVVLTDMVFRPTMGEALLTASGAENKTRTAMENLHQTVGDTLKVLTKGVSGVPPIYSPGVQLRFSSTALSINLTPQQKFLQDPPTMRPEVQKAFEETWNANQEIFRSMSKE